jgi:quercetin dioxygenase-like cupin family protein
LAQAAFVSRATGAAETHGSRRRSIPERRSRSGLLPAASSGYSSGVTSRSVSKALLRGLLAGAICVAPLGPAHAAEPVPMLPGEFHWFNPPTNPAVQGAWVVGAEDKTGPYVLRVKLAAGGKIPPHTHPDERSSTVLAGTLYVGFGTTFDETKVVAVPAGAVYVAPATVPHYVWAKDGEAVYQESGVGPTATTPVVR